MGDNGKKKATEKRVIWSNVIKNHMSLKEARICLFAVYITPIASQEHSCVSKHIFPKQAAQNNRFYTIFRFKVVNKNNLYEI